MMSMSWDDFYAKDLQIYDERDASEIKYDYLEMSDFKELSINKLLINNTSIVSALDTISIKKVLIEKLILDQAEILSFLNSDASGSSSFLSKDYSSYLQNGLKSLRNFEISDISMSDNESRRKFLDINSLQLNNVKFDYLGDKGNKKIPISFEFNIDEVDYNYKNVSYGNSMLRDLELAADTLNYDAIKFKFGGKWDWNTRRNNLSINLDLGASDAISLKLKSSFVDLSTDFLNLTGAPLATYFMTQPKLKSLDISLNDNSLKNRLIESYAESENMTSEQTKDFVVQSLDIFITTLGIKNSVVENLQESLNNFIYDSSNLTLSANPSKPVSFTDLMPDFTSPDANQVINKLNLKMSNRLF